MLKFLLTFDKNSAYLPWFLVRLDFLLTKLEKLISIFFLYLYLRDRLAIDKQWESERWTLQLRNYLNYKLLVFTTLTKCNAV